MIIYKGPSVLTGAPIVAIATGVNHLGQLTSANDKTGSMVQVWILPDDGIAPHHAAKLGQDDSVCGNCPQRHHSGGACYVTLFQAPLAIWTCYMSGGYEDYAPDDLAGTQVRFGAYGDPAAVPYSAWAPILEECDIDHSTGYTHQLHHPNFDHRITLFCQVSADTPKSAARAQSMGYKTFRVAGDAQKRLPGEIECLADSHGVSCADCAKCDGQTANVVITIHGARANTVKTHDVLARG